MSVRPDARAPGLHVGEAVSLDASAVIGAHVTIHDGTTVGAGCVISDGAVLGKQPQLARHSRAPRGALAGLVLEPDVTVGTGAIVFAGALIEAEAILGDQSFIRERSRIGPGSVIGRGSVIDPLVTVGARARLQTNVYVTQGSLIEDDVFVGPGVCTTNDNTMARHDADYELCGAILRRACRVGAGVILLPGIEVGEEAFIGAGAVVTRSVTARDRVAGVPARSIGRFDDRDLLERWR
jgi:acetyltransferase-like isoleucine patch superfamily enzyme